MQQRDPQGGYVLVALLASSAIMLAALALAIPRMAVQSQRVREETLVYRGKQYQRAIRLYFREHKKYPEELDDLEDTNGVRYLRKRYKDPLTGEDQWRMIHIGADGRFKDSLIYDLAEEADESEDDGFGSSFDHANGPSSFGDPAHLAGLRDGAPSSRPLPGQFQGGVRARAVRKSVAPDQTQQVRYNQGFEFPVGTQAAGPGPAVGPNGQPIQQPPDYRTMLPSQMPMHENRPRPPNPNAPFGQRRQQQPGRPGFGAGRGLQGLGGVLPAGVLPSPAAGPTPGQLPSGSARPPVTAGGAPAAFGRQGAGGSATSIIQRLLTTPRPGGLAGLQGYQQQAASAGGAAAAFQEGIAGVASMVEDLGVKTYAGREMYNEWEFVYDYRKDMGNGMNPAGGGTGARPQGAAARGLGSNPGVAGGIAPNSRQRRADPRSPALRGGYPGGFGAANSQSPGTASRPGYGYGAQPSGAGPYQPTANDPYRPAGNNLYRPTGTPSPYGVTPGAAGPSQSNRPDGPPLPYRPPASNADPRKR